MKSNFFDFPTSREEWDLLTPNVQYRRYVAAQRLVRKLLGEISQERADELAGGYHPYRWKIWLTYRIGEPPTLYEFDSEEERLAFMNGLEVQAKHFGMPSMILEPTSTFT